MRVTCGRARHTRSTLFFRAVAMKGGTGMSEQENLQRMTQNTVRQELDGLRYQIAKALRFDWKDSHDLAGLSDAERAEVLSAVLESVWENLERFDIRPGDMLKGR